jgi:hypothetical protein
VKEFEKPRFDVTCTLGLYGLVMLISLLSLYAYHLNLISVNETTNEVGVRSMIGRPKTCVPVHSKL